MENEELWYPLVPMLWKQDVKSCGKHLFWKYYKTQQHKVKIRGALHFLCATKYKILWGKIETCFSPFLEQKHSFSKGWWTHGVLTRVRNETQLTLCEPWIMLINKLRSNRRFLSVWLLPPSYLYTQFIQQVFLVSGVQHKKNCHLQYTRWLFLPFTSCFDSVKLNDRTQPAHYAV